MREPTVGTDEHRRRRNGGAPRELEQQSEIADAIREQASSFSELAAGLKANGALWSGTMRIGTDGTKVWDAHVNFASLTIRAHGADVVVAQSSASSVPTEGVGTFLIRGGTMRTVAMAGNQFCLFGTPGAYVEVTAWVHQQVPVSAELHGEGVDASAVVRVAGILTSTVLAPANPFRRGITIYHENPSGTALYVTLGPVTTLTSYTVQIVGGGFYEIPGPPYYRGAISGLFTAATGAAQVTELQ